LADLEQNARRKARGATPMVISPIALRMVQRIVTIQRRPQAVAVQRNRFGSCL
jgi:hypothetical protein